MPQSFIGDPICHLSFNRIIFYAKIDFEIKINFFFVVKKILHIFVRRKQT